jgi:SAM-dependent methyltransferase
LREVLSASVFAVDRSADMISKAAQKAGLGGIRLVRGDAEALPLKPGSVDAVFTAMVYHHIGDKPAALRECARVLRPGGRLLIYTPTREALASYLWLRFFPTAFTIDTERMPSRPELVDTVCRASFELERQVIVRRPFTLGLREYAERVGMRAFSTLRLVPDEEFETGMTALRRYCAERDRDETIDEEFDAFLFRSRAPSQR